MRPIAAAQHLPQEPGVYQIRNDGNGKSYVGSSKNIRTRCCQHIRALNRGTHHGRKLLNAWKKHGADVFSFHVLELCPEASLIEREAHWMVQLNVEAHGYNTFAATPTGRGYTQSPEHIERRTAGQRGRSPSPDARDAVAEGNRRRVWTPEQREASRVRLAQGKAQIPKEEFSQKLSQSMQGRTVTEEHRKKLSVARTGQTWRDKPGGEERAKAVGKKLQGVTRSQETKDKISMAQEGQWSGSPEAKERARARALKCWESRRANGKSAPSSTTQEE